MINDNTCSKSFHTSQEDSFDYKNLGYDYNSLYEALSSKYCMCDMLEGHVNYSPLFSNFLNISSLLCAGSQTAPQMNTFTSTLYNTYDTPKLNHAGCFDDTRSPSTLEQSPTVLKPLSDINFTSCSINELNGYQLGMKAQF